MLRLGGTRFLVTCCISSLRISIQFPETTKKNIQIGAAQSHPGKPDVDIFISYLNM